MKQQWSDVDAPVLDTFDMPGRRFPDVATVALGATPPEASSTPARTTTLPRAVLLLLALVTSVAPLSLDLYLPSLPDLRLDFHASVPGAQLTVTAFIIGLACGQLVAATVTDALGRRRPLLVGMSLWSLATLACAVMPTVEALTGMRLIQGTCAGVGMAIAPAVINDLDPNNLIKHISRMLLIIAVVPVVSPMLGGFMLQVTSWRGCFLILAGVGVALTGVVLLLLPESLPRQDRTRLDLGVAIRGNGAMIADRAFFVPALVCGISFGVLFAHIANSPFIFRDFYHLTATEYGGLFGVNATGLILGMQLSSVLVNRVGARRAQLATLSTGITASLLLLVFSQMSSVGVAGVTAALFVVLAATGLSIPVASAAAIGMSHGGSGRASGLLGMVQFGCGGLVGTLSSLGGARHGALPLAVVATACLTVSLLVALFGDSAPTASMSHHELSDVI